VVSQDRYEPYAAAVCSEIGQTAASTAAEIRDVSVDTVYFGGGTPSLLAPVALESILDRLSDNFSFERPKYQKSAQEENAEITLEADPETITRGKAEAWLRAGFNRISLGAQSFSDTELQATGRMHRRADIFAAAHGSSRGRLPQYQPGSDCRAAAPNAGIVGGIDRAGFAHSARTLVHLHA